MKIFFINRLRLFDEDRFFEFHRSLCTCTMKGCKKAKRGKRALRGYNIYFGRKVLVIQFNKPKGCNYLCGSL